MGRWAGRKKVSACRSVPQAAGRRQGEKYLPDIAGTGKRFTIQTHRVKFVEDDSTF